LNETRTLAGFLSGLRFEDLPSSVVDITKQCVLDIVGVAVGATRWPWPGMVAEVVADTQSAHQSSVWGMPLRASAAGAALVNGVSAHGIEMDDRSPRASVHPGAYAVSAAMAVTESRHASGEELIASIVAGYELGMRVGYAMRMRVGVHKSGHKGVWLGVGAAGRALRLDPDQMLNAYGLAGSMASGLFQFSQDPSGTMVKRLHGGLGAHNGILAAQLARTGLTGPSAALEGKFGYIRIYGRDDFDPLWDELTKDLGTTFKILEREVKPYAAWGGSHVAIDAVARILEDGPIDPADVVGIRVGGSNRLTFAHESTTPESEMAAQYSLPFMTALSVVRGPGSLVDPISLWTPETLRDKEILRLAAATTLVIDDDLEEIAVATNHYGGARVTVTLRDGTQREAVVHHSKGTVENPMTYDEIEQKFRRMSGAVLPTDQVDRVLDLVRSLEKLDDVAELGAALRTA
jgi:2-methylcitrate dehydratase PrpD